MFLFGFFESVFSTFALNTDQKTRNTDTFRTADAYLAETIVSTRLRSWCNMQLIDPSSSLTYTLYMIFKTSINTKEVSCLEKII